VSVNVSGRGEYGRHVPLVSRGGTLATVDPGSPADKAGLRVGDSIMTADGEPLRDVIDWQWLADGSAVDVKVVSAKPDAASTDSGAGRTVRLQRDAGVPWGLAFAETVFDGVRTCRNRCAFCFMTQLPKGLRRALYLRDDDYRLSFLQGNFVTLTNLSDGDVSRIAEQHLSPLYVSLHSVDPQIRAQLVCASDDRALDRFDELLGAGIGLHVQIVLVPGVNDDAALKQSLTWLAEREGVLSVGIVPLGFTAHQQRFRSSFELPTAAGAVIAAVEPWQVAMRERDGCTWVHLADEFYLNAGVAVPPAEQYDDFPQYENGIGMVRDFSDDFAAQGVELASAIAALPDAPPVTLATGELFAPVLADALGAIDPTGRVAVLGVRNDFFGGNVSVAGLLTTSDLTRACAETPLDGLILLPDCVANADGVLLDGVAVSELGTALGREVRLLSCDVGGLLSGLRDAADNPPIT
jgi:putative radical SAM enzyme (TIGR03279 family)